jgi:cell division protein YceG involved in septum cleavage
MITPYEFLKNRDETGRLIVRMLDGTNKQYYVEFIEPRGGVRTDWGSYNPSTGEIENKKGAGKFNGGVSEKDSIITVENGFSKESAETIYEGASFMSTIDTLHTKWKKENGYA